MNANPSEQPARLLSISAWVMTLLVSDLPEILWYTFTGEAPSWIWWRAGLAAVFFAGCLAWKKIRPLWQYALVLGAFLLISIAANGVRHSAWWVSRFNSSGATFTGYHLGFQMVGLGEVLVMVALLFLLKRRRQEFFMQIGEIKAPVQPVRWLGVGQGTLWSGFGWVFSLIAAGGTLLYVIIAGWPYLNRTLVVLPLLPLILLVAALNGVREEVTYRASLVSTSYQVIGPRQAVWMTAVFFGLAHYLRGSPGLLPGFLMVTFLGFIMAKSMVETRGSFWAWFIHFVQDVVVYYYYALITTEVPLW